MTQIALDQAVPDIEISSTGEKTIKFSDYRGKYLVVYFYPKDNTPGCTQEGQSFRDNIDQFTALNAIVLGVSRDSVKVHEGFKCKQQFPFDLLADQDETLCQLFDVIKMKNMYGKEVRGIERSTFLIDPQGLLVREWRKVKVKELCQDVLKALSELPS
ncbi:MAG: peroxiredoxin [Methylococcales bacterium]|nr:peroxiredoxin [Methylococcaceae bacterium]